MQGRYGKVHEKDLILLALHFNGVIFSLPFLTGHDKNEDIPKLVTNSHEGLNKRIPEGVERNPPLLNSAFFPLEFSCPSLSIDYIVRKGSKVLLLSWKLGKTLNFKPFSKKGNLMRICNGK